MEKKELLEQQGHFEPIFVARQPVFDLERRVWGYELLFRHGPGAQAAQVDDPDVATARVIADGFALASAGIAPGQRTLINFPANLILKDAAFALPREVCVVEILETVEATKEILAACRRIKEAGYLLALDDFVGQPGFEEIIALADIVKVEVLGQAKPALIRMTQALKRPGLTLLAEKVEDKDTLAFCRSLGFSLFQGYYFSRPEIVPGRKIAPGALSKIRLMHALATDAVENAELAGIVSSDVSLTHRLLTFVNSAAMGLLTKVSSMEQAVTLLGRRPLKQWLMVVTLSDMALPPRAGELSFVCIQRGRFLQTLAGALARFPVSGETMFLLGLLSRLDALLGQPMEEILAGLPLDDAVKAALLGEKNLPALTLRLVEDIETASWGRAEKILAHLGIGQDQAAVLHSKAAAWAGTVLGEARAAQGPPRQ